MSLIRKNKARLAFEMLEKEFQVLSVEEMREIKGGEGPNGYCFFNCMNYFAEKYKGISYDPAYLLEQYSFHSSGFLGDQRGISYTENGSLLGVNMNNSIAMAELQSIGINGIALSNPRDFNTTLNNGGVILTNKISKGPNGEEVTHQIIIKGINPETGEYIYYDPTDDKTYKVKSEEINLTTFIAIYDSANTGSTGNGYAESTNTNVFYGSSGLITTGYDDNGYWENFYIYNENGPYTAGEQSWGHAALNYSTGYNYSKGSSTGYSSTGE